MFFFIFWTVLFKKLPHPEDPNHLLKMKLSYQTVLFATGRPICDDGDVGDDDEDDDGDDDDHSSRCGTATRPPVAEPPSPLSLYTSRAGNQSCPACRPGMLPCALLLIWVYSGCSRFEVDFPFLFWWYPTPQCKRLSKSVVYLFVPQEKNLIFNSVS